jgi:hypothetical protein
VRAGVSESFAAKGSGTPGRRAESVTAETAAGVVAATGVLLEGETDFITSAPASAAVTMHNRPPPIQAARGTPAIGDSGRAGLVELSTADSFAEVSEFMPTSLGPVCHHVASG